MMWAGVLSALSICSWRPRLLEERRNERGEEEGSLREAGEEEGKNTGAEEKIHTRWREKTITMIKTGQRDTETTEEGFGLE